MEAPLCYDRGAEGRLGSPGKGARLIDAGGTGEVRVMPGTRAMAVTGASVTASSSVTYTSNADTTRSSGAVLSTWCVWTTQDEV